MDKISMKEVPTLYVLSSHQIYETFLDWQGKGTFQSYSVRNQCMFYSR